MNVKLLGDHSTLGRHAVWLAAIVLLSLLVGCVLTTPTRTVDIASKGNGMPVAGEFHSFFQENGGLRVFGFPLTEAYIDSDSERLVQYFQRLRLEYDRSEERVVVSPLGQWALPDPAEQVIAPQAETQAPERVITNDLQVQDAFLTFYEAHGGENLFGQAISAQLDEGGTRAQYFENARLEWRPEAPLGYRVQPGRLGEVHYRQVGIFRNPGRSRPLDSAGVREADVSASLRAPILYAGEEQIIYVEVKTPEGQRPVAGVSVDLTVHYNGKAESFSLVETDGAGRTHGKLPLSDLQPGQKVRVVVEASAPGGSTIGATSKSFKSWW